MLQKAAHLPPITAVPIATIRASDATRYKVGVVPDAVASTEDRLIAGPGGAIGIRIYRPDAAAGHAVTVFFHGSGFVICNLESHDDMCRQICRRAGTVVVSVDYRLAPEHKFPAAPDDCLAATGWVAIRARLRSHAVPTGLRETFSRETLMRSPTSSHPLVGV